MKNIKKLIFVNILTFIMIQISFFNIYISYATETEIEDKNVEEINEEQPGVKDGIYIIRTSLNEKYGLDVSYVSKKDGLIYNYMNM